MKRKRIIIGAIVVIVVIVIAIWGLGQATASATPSVRMQTATIERGTLIATVNAAGNVSTPEDAVMAFQTSGRVVKVNVQVGDKVSKGQALMELDTTDLELALKSTKASLVSTQASYDATKTNLQFALRTAQASLASSMANLEASQAKNAQNSNSLIVAKAQLDKALIALQKAQREYDAIAWRGDVGMTSQATTLQTATIDYQTALADYRVTVAGINDTTLKQAQTQVEKDQVTLEQAQRNLDTSMRTAQAQLDRDQIAVETAQRNREKARIYAPFDGMVAAVNFSVGDSAGTGNAITIVDLANLQVRVTLAEVDLAKIKPGQAAQMTLDALPGKTYNAKVLAVGPVGTITQGVVNYPIIISLTENDGSVKPGMTANVAIVIEQRDNVLMVPNRAVRTQGNQKIVTALYKGQTIPVPVTIGLTNDQYTEVTSGLQEGDQIVLNQTQLSQSRGGGFGIPGIGQMFIRGGQ